MESVKLNTSQCVVILNLSSVLSSELILPIILVSSHPNGLTIIIVIIRINLLLQWQNQSTLALFEHQ
jgi:hypothetical protein